MIKVYGGPFTRASIVYWYLAELGIPYQAVPVDLQAGAQHTAAYRAIHPIGMVPALDDDGTKVFESGAVLLYLADKYGNMPKTPEGRAAIYSWMLYTNATLIPAVFADRNRAALMERAVEPLEQVLTGKEFLVGNEFTVADSVGTVLAWAAMVLRVSYNAYPAVRAYAGRMAERPAFKKTILG